MFIKLEEAPDRGAPIFGHGEGQNLRRGTRGIRKANMGHGASGRFTRNIQNSHVLAEWGAPSTSGEVLREGIHAGLSGI